MTLSELIQEVYNVTNRPDYVGETLMAVRSATLKMHHVDFFDKDLFETPITFSTPDFNQSFEPKIIAPLYRAPKYLRKYDAVNLKAGDMLTAKELTNIFDDYGSESTNIYYGAGAEINIKMSTQEQYMLFGCYLHPNILPTAYSSWIAEEYPYAIVFEAATTISRLMGDMNKYKMYRELATEQIATIIGSNVTLIGQ